MDALEQIVERQSTVKQDDDFAIQHEFPGLQFRQGLHHFWKISRKRLTGLRL